MLVTNICENCGKEYTYDDSLGPWRKDNTQGEKSERGASVKRFCCYECKLETQHKKLKTTWNNKTQEERQEILQRQRAGAKEQRCVVCGKVFKPKASTGNPHKIYLCSDECREEYYSKEPPSGTYKCQYCGKEFHYEHGQGSWNKDNQLVKAKGLNHDFVMRSYKYCCFECGVKDKEAKRKKTNIEKYGNYTPWQNPQIFNEMIEKKKKEGTLFTSKPEKEIKDYIESLGFKTDKYIIGNGIQTQRFEIDIYIPEKKIGVEFNGAYFHSINGRKKGRLKTTYHYQKAKRAQEEDIELIQIWEDQWINQQDLIKSILKARLGVIDKNHRIFARKCTVKEIDNETYREFVTKNHIQGYKRASVKLGLFYNDQLVQIASFSHTNNMGKANNQNELYDYEWSRGCPASLNFVIGGTSKLFKYFVKKYNPNSILCYADWNLFNGNGYKECGFDLIGYTGPDKFYIQAKPIKRITRSPFKYKEYKDLVEQNKLWLCYGAGSLKFSWKNNN